MVAVNGAKLFSVDSLAITFGADASATIFTIFIDLFFFKHINYEDLN